MTTESSKIIIDDNLVLDVNTGIIGSPVIKSAKKSQEFPTKELISQIDKLDEAIQDLESSFDSYSISTLSLPNREGTYHNAGLLTNIVIGIIIALFMIIILL